jgi:AraC family ethanolamine operon transcriptional activator
LSRPAFQCHNELTNDYFIATDDLCRHVGVSRRNLQDLLSGCLRHLAVAVLARRASRRRASRTESAGRNRTAGLDRRRPASWGFGHWSGFARNYRELFGELPSQTLQYNPFVPN